MKKTFLKTVALVLVLALAFSVNVFSFSAFAEEISQTDAIPEGYIEIASAYALNKIRDNLSGKYIITQDIDMDGYNWTPIGTSEEPFTGVLDGNKKILTNFKINNENVTTATNIGLFGCTSNATISNLFIKEANITVKQTYTSVIKVNVGVLAGTATQTVFKDCIVTGNVIVESIRSGSVGGVIGKAIVCSLNNIINAADVSVKTDAKLATISIGGIAGSARSGMINQCSNYGDIFASGTDSSSETRLILAGGIAGGTEDYANQILNSYNQGTIGVDFTTPSTCVGGIIGDCWYVKNCYSTGGITVPENFSGCVGAIAGDFCTTVLDTNPAPRIENVYYSNEGLYTSYVCSNPPSDDSAFINAKKLTAEEFKDKNSFTGFDFNNMWDMDENGLPVLKKQVSFYTELEEEHIINGESSGECGKNLNYTFNTYTGDLHIFGTGDMDNYDSASALEGFFWAPWFRERNYVKNVVIENGVTSIGSCAFDGCENMTSIVIPGSVKKIGWSAFEGCESLEGLELPVGLETIDSTAFMGCSGIKSISIPETLTNLDPDCFYGIPYLESITVDSENPRYSSDEFGVLFNKDKTVLEYYPEGNTRTSYTVPDGVTEIGYAAFRSSLIAEVILPESLKEIGWNAFETCSNLKEIIIPDGVEEIGGHAFTFCTKLEKVKLPSSLKGLHYLVFYHCESLKSIEIPDSVTYITYRVFWYCKSLETVVLPDTLIELDGNSFAETAYFNNAENREGYALYNGKYLLDVLPEATGKFEVKDGTELIVGDALSGCKNLTEIVIPDTVKTIGDGAFSGCVGLSSVVIPKNVTKVGNSLFYSCDNLQKVEFEGNISAVEKNTFYDCVKLTDVKLPDTVTVIDEAAFRECDSLEKIVLPDGVETIGAQAFGWCRNLSEINIPESLTSIGRNAFVNTKLKTLNIPQNVEFIDKLAFSGIETLESITVDENSNHFASIDNKVLVSKDMTKVVLYAAKAEGALFAIPDAVTTIDEDAFSYTENLEKITIPDSVTEYGSYMFRNSKNLKSVALGSGITRLGTYFMENCESLEKLYLSDSVKNISFMALYGCTNLKDIYYGGTEEEWSEIKMENGNSPLNSATIHYNHVHSHNYSGYAEATEYQNGYELYTCECGHYYAVFDVVSKSDKYDVTATYSPDCFNEEITLDVEEVTGNRDPGGIYVVDGKTYVQVGIYNLKPVNENGEVVQPNEGQTVKMKIAIPDEYKYKTDMVIYHRFVDGGREQLSTADGTLVIENGYMIFEVSKFSEFEIYASTAYVKIIDTPLKTVYKYGEKLDLTGIKLTYVADDGTTKTVTDTSVLTISGFDSTKTGTQTVTVSYEQCSDTFDVTVRMTFWQWLLRIFSFWLHILQIIIIAF